MDANIQSLKDAKIPQCSSNQYHAHFVSTLIDNTIIKSKCNIEKIVRRYSELLYSASALLEKLEGQDRLKVNAKLTLLRKVRKKHKRHIKYSINNFNSKLSSS